MKPWEDALLKLDGVIGALQALKGDKETVHYILAQRGGHFVSAMALIWQSLKNF